MKKHLRTRTLALGAAGVGLAGGMAGLGTFATFTGSTQASHSIASGTVVIALGTPGANNRLTTGATGLVPGDTVQRRVKLTNTGSENLASVTLTTSATTTSLLDTDGTNGLQLKIEKCGGVVGWTESLSGPPYTYTCDGALAGDGLGVRSTVLASRPVVGSTLGLTGLSSLSAAGFDDMVVTLTLPSTAGDSFQGKTSTINYQFDAIQRGAAAK